MTEVSNKEQARSSVAQRIANRALPVALVLLSFLAVFSCALYNPASFVQNKSDPKAIPITAPQITLQWDPPASGASSVASYVVSFRMHGASSWTTLATIPATATPSYVVPYSAVGAGSFDFGVVAVSSGGTNSPEHTSLDTTADPHSGWYLNWWGP